MPKDQLTEADLKRELDDLQSRSPRLDHNEIFIAWFLRAFVTADEGLAISALCGGSRDKDVDAVLIDDSSRCVFIVQGKYRNKLMRHGEKRPDVMSFANLAAALSGDEEQYTILSKKISPDVQDRLTKAREKILKFNYELQLFYVTTGKASTSLKEEARKSTRTIKECNADFELIDGHRILALLDYYLRDVAPPVASMDLEMESGNGVEVRGIFHRYDSKMDIESWVFSMTGHEVAKMYEEAGPRLFALNIRGYQGDTDINEGMEETLEQSPEYFWYYNNGLTIVCEKAEKITSHGRDILRVSSPQVINGQQTTRTLAKMMAYNSKASVTVRVIRVPHTMETNSDHFDTLVSQIVKSTNWQNYIVPSDLIANDRRQIEINRQFRNLGYWYVRKRQTRGEARREAGGKQYKFINKTELAQAVAGCELDPAVVRRGKERLFEEKLYGSIFPTSEPYFYLKRFWLMKEVEFASKGYPERAYAKWLVLNFMWKEISQYLNSMSKRIVFEREWKIQKGDTVFFLWKANTEAFRAALDFYRFHRGKGDKATDVSSFFKRTNLHTEFAKFWSGSKNTHKSKFNRYVEKFDLALHEDDNNEK
jgi:AIPR protein